MTRSIIWALLVYVPAAVATHEWLRIHERLDPVIGGAIWPLYWIAKAVAAAVW